MVKAVLLDRGGGYMEWYMGSMPPFLWAAIESNSPVGAVFISSEPAYAALGAALRKVVAFADGVKEVMG